MKWVIGFFLLGLMSLGLASDEEVGAYQRKSVTYLNAVWLMDASVRGMPDRLSEKLLKEIKQETSLKRFDYNPVPKEMIAGFVKKANAQKNLKIEDVSNLLEETLLKEILAVVDLEKEARAQNLLTEQQQNSFFSDKAKELGITKQELDQVMNSAYMYIPVASGFSARHFGGQFEVEMNVGILWFKILRGDKENGVQLVVKKITRVEGVSQIGHIYGGYGSYKDYAFGKLIEQAAKNLKVATQAYEEFQLSGQILETKGDRISLDIGKREGLGVDDKYEVFEERILKDGTAKKMRVGWVIIDEVAGKSNSKGTAVYGEPDLGMEVKEYPLMKLEIGFGMKSFYTKVNSDVEMQGQKIFGDEILEQTQNLIGPSLSVAYNIGAKAGISQLFGSLSTGIGFGGVEFLNGSFTENSTLVTWNVNAELMKKFYLWGPLKVGLGVGALVQQTAFSVDHLSNRFDLQEDFEFLAFGFSGMSLLEIDLGLQWSLNLNGRYTVFPGEGEWRVNGEQQWVDGSIGYDGVSIGLQFQYSPKSLKIDPLDMIRGNLR